MSILSTPSSRNKQHGFALMVLIAIVGAIGLFFLVQGLSASRTRTERDAKTAVALKIAKDAVIGWSAGDSTPGRLPCPEETLKIGTPSEGDAKSSCTLPAIGRLPWRTLGIPEIRDGNGDHIWYVISDGFRTSPINSDTQAKLTVDGVPNAAVAIVFSPGPQLPSQARHTVSAATPPDVAQYLDSSNNGGSNSFVSTGPPATFNDKLLLIRHDELFAVVEKRVAKEVAWALLEYYCGDKSNYDPNIDSCKSVHPKAQRFFPQPAPFSDVNCLGNASISSPPPVPPPPYPCSTSLANYEGRIPANLWPALEWTDVHSDSLLRGESSSNWFQKNKWRELTYYAVSPKCVSGTILCNGLSGSFLTVNIAPGTAVSSKRIVVIVAGGNIASLGQTRSNNTEKTTLSNYLEDQNVTTGDFVYSVVPASPTAFNDRTVFVPW